MSSVSALCCIVCLLPTSFALSATKRKGAPTYTFEDFVKEFNRQYAPNTEEWETRQAIFHKRKAEVLAQQSKPDSKWEAGFTKFMDYTDAEFKSIMGLKRRAHSKKGGAFSLIANVANEPREGWAPRPDGGHDYVFDAKASIPSHVDLRTLTRDLKHKKLVEFNRDQGSCGSCWATAVANVMDYHIHKNETNFLELMSTLTDSELPTVSTQSVVSCTKNLLHCGGTGGCQGATSQLGFEQVWKQGMPLAEHYTYTSGSGRDSACDESKIAKSKIFISGYWQLPMNKQAPLLHAVANMGAVAVSVDASSWAFYSRGIFDGALRDRTVNHAVTLFGYQKPVDGKDGFYLIKNSWGQNWGENGFIRLAMPEDDEKNCGMDLDTHVGIACDGDPDQDLVCGSSGILYDSALPKKVSVRRKL